jgi:CRISPR/Cas system-associated exonuclease Cas4 (RecB family)
MTFPSLSKLMDKSICDTYEQEHREYIGASSIGNACARSIWYAFHDAPRTPLTAKQIRTFKIGKQLESILKDELRTLNIDFVDSEELIACYDEEISIFKGNLDGLIEINGMRIAVEIKTANDASFNNFKKNGLYTWSQIYYAQVQSYMGMKKIPGAYIVVLNKNTGETHDEYVEFNEIYYAELKMKAKQISEAKEPPERLNKNPVYYICAMCPFKEICHS